MKDLTKVSIENYYLRDNADKNYEKILYRDRKGVQASEHNEQEEIFERRLTSALNALFRDGDIIRDAQIAVNAQTGEVQAGSGAVYLSGAVRGVAPATFTIPTKGSVAVGIYLESRIISEIEDPELRNPAKGSNTEGEPGAWRLQVNTAWGYEGDGRDGDFYVVHVVDDGVVRSKEAPPNLDSFNRAIAGYDRDSTGGGSYVVSGLKVLAAEDSGGGAQIYTIGEGKARVHGFGIELTTSRRLSYDAKPDLRYLDTEIVTATGEARQRIDVAHAPIHNITLLRATLQKTVELRHGSYNGCTDALPDTAIVAILECKQGDTVFETSEYKKTGDGVDWSPSGNEPASGSTYSCTYTYMTAVEALEQDYDGFCVEGAVAGTSIIISYNQAVPRYDRLCVTSDGAFVWIQGVAAEINPRPPVAPEAMLPIATVYQTWRDKRDVINDGVRVVSFDTLEALSSRVDYALQEISRQRLEAEASTREDGTRVGIFVDPLLDDSMRDQGVAQTAAIIDGSLVLPISPKVHALAAPLAAPIAPVYAVDIALAQLLRTSDMKVNPYMSFGIPPAKAVLTPAVDNFTEVETNWASAITRRFDTGHYVVGRSTLTSQSVTTTNQVLSSTTTDLEYLRQIYIQFMLEGFGPEERLQSVVFDGVEVDFEPDPCIADESGIVRGRFMIPPKIPAGSKNVLFRGNVDGGSSGSGIFVGQGKLTVQTLRQVHTVVNYWVDPLAQTFVLDTAEQICGVDLWFTAKGGDARVQIREVSNGVPTRTILAEAIIPESSIVISGGGHTRAEFPVLVKLEAMTEYAVVVLCDDPTTAVAIAEMGEFDRTAQKWVSSQPYTVGVLLSSSNASTWTAHQDKDLTFRLLKANFTEGVHTFDMGVAQIENTTDMVLLALDETPTADTRVEFELTMPGGDAMTLAQGQPVRLAQPVNGEVSVRAKMTSKRGAGPLLWPAPQLLTGEVGQTADYVSRSIPAVGAIKAVLIFDAYVPSGAAIAPELQIDAGAWQGMELKNTVNQGDGVVEYRYETALTTADEVKAKIVLSGTSAARPSVSKIRFMALK